MIACDRLSVEQAAEDAFLHALGHRPEKRVDGVIVEHGHGQESFVRIVGHPVGRGKGQHDLARAIAAVAARAGEAHQRPVAEPPELPLAERDVRGQHRDDGAFILVGRDVCLQQLLDGGTAHNEIIKHGMVGEDKGTNGIVFSIQLHHPGSRPDAALEAVAAHPSARAHSALGKISLAVGQCVKNVLLGDMQAPDVVQTAVVALAHHRVHAARRLTDIRILGQHILDQRRLHRAHAEGVGKEDGRFQRAQLVDLNQAGGLAKAVDDMAGGQQLLVEEIPRVGQQGRHARLDIAVRQGAVAHRHAGHVADLIQRPVGQMADGQIPFCRDSHKDLPPRKPSPPFIAQAERVYFSQSSCWTRSMVPRS